MNINEIMNQKVVQNFEGICEFALFSMNKVNTDPLEYKINDFTTKKTYFSCVELVGFILPKEVFTIPNKVRLEIRSICEIVEYDDKGVEKTTYQSDETTEQIFAKVVYQLLKNNKSITVNGIDCKIINIQPTKYKGQCDLVETK